jgi:hypothetical protein
METKRERLLCSTSVQFYFLVESGLVTDGTDSADPA